MQKVSIYVDVQNIYYTTKQIHNCHFDYNAFWQKVILNRKVVKAVAYAIESKDEKQRQFQNILRGIGFEVKLKPFIQRIDSSAKGDWDVGITVDILEYAEESDIIILASGDGDFDILDKIIEITCSYTNLSNIQKEIQKNDSVTIDKAELALVPNSTVSLDKNQSSQTLKLLDELEDLDDVQKVFTNADFNDESVEMYSKTI